MTHPHPVRPARTPSEAIELLTAASTTRVAFFTLFVAFLGEIRHAKGEREKRAGELAIDHVGAQRRANGGTYFSSKTTCPKWREGKSMVRRGYGRATRDGKFEERVRTSSHPSQRWRRTFGCRASSGVGTRDEMILTRGNGHHRKW